MPRIPPRLQKQDLQKSRSIPDSCSRDSALRRRTTHRPAPARPASISPPAPRPLDPNVLQPLRLHRSSGFRIRQRPTLFDSPLSPASPWRQRAIERSEEHTSELQSRQYLVCRLLLEKKKIIVSYIIS